MPRATCPQCERPVSVCVCALITVQCNELPLIILQHPDECGHPLNTAGLAVRGLERAVLRMGMRFHNDAEALEVPAAWLSHPYLLYPGTAAQLVPLSHEISTSLAPSSTAALVPPQLPSVLVVLDGTWRNSRELLLTHDWLNALTRWTLPDDAPGRYRIRQARQKGGLSTIEAIARTFARLQPDFDERLLLAPFEQMINRQIACMGEDTFRRHYGDDAEP